jgi:hypothetical protein
VTRSRRASECDLLTRLQIAVSTVKVGRQPDLCNTLVVKMYRLRTLVPALVAVMLLVVAAPYMVAAGANVRRAVAAHKTTKHSKHKKRRRRGRYVDGPICPEWGTSLPCRCPSSDVQASRRSVLLAPGDGWVEIILTYPPPSISSSCPGGVSIESTFGEPLSSVGYLRGPGEDPGPGIPSGSVTAFALAPGVWKAVAGAGERRSATETFTVTAGQGTKLAINLP